MPTHQHSTIFDAGQGYAPFSRLVTLVDCTVAWRQGRWWMYLCGHDTVSPEIELYSASLPEGSPLSATGWALTPDPNDPARPSILAGKSRSHWWDGRGGRHCVSYAEGFDPDRNARVERLYYAGAARHYSGPYAIGYLEWDGGKWVDQAMPAFTANEYWERGSVYEPNLIYHEGMWKMWYVAGANQDDYLVQGYAESPNGRTDWSFHEIVFPADEKVFDFCLVEANGEFEAVFSRVNVSGKEADPSRVGLFWCHTKTPSPRMADWSEPVRISDPGAWKPVLRYGENDAQRMLVFHDGAYPAAGRGRLPINFTVECLEIDRPAS